ncbi:MAG: methylmalonyl-CoA mutase family protein [Fimbriimonadaceae bacterium]
MDTVQTSKSLFREEFPPVSTAEWMSVVEKDLKGADFEKRLVAKTEDGLRIQPIYRADSGTPVPVPVPPKTWRIQQTVFAPDLPSANAIARDALNRGAEELEFSLFPGGYRVESAEDLKALLDGVFLEMVPVSLNGGPATPILTVFLQGEVARRGLAPEAVAGGLVFDPVLDACAGRSDVSVDVALDAVPDWFRDVAASFPKMRSLTVHAGRFQEAGAGVTQELGFGLALLVEYLAKLQAEGIDLATAVPKIQIRFAVGSQYFLEIAKLRAARLLVVKVCEAFGVVGARPEIHAATSRSTKTLYDPYVNMLRATTESMAAAIAGVDSINVEPYDSVFRTADAFSQRIARNTQILLREEAYLDKTADPLAGSYAVEALTDSVADLAWKLFQEVEAMGGFLTAWKSGFVPDEIAKSRAAKEKAAVHRRQPIVGTSNYPNAKETRLRDLAVSAAPTAFHAVLDGKTRLSDILTKVQSGAKTSDWAVGPAAPGPLAVFRAAEPFEKLRLRVEKAVEAGMRQPTVMLLLAGDAKMRKARATFCAGFFGCGGYRVVETGPFADVEEAGKAACENQADFVVLCSSDDAYLELAVQTRDALTHAQCAVPIVVAGYPEAQLEALREAGVNEFVHIRSDVVATLTRYHAALGIPELE